MSCCTAISACHCRQQPHAQSRRRCQYSASPTSETPGIRAIPVCMVPPVANFHFMEPDAASRAYTLPSLAQISASILRGGRGGGLRACCRHKKSGRRCLKLPRLPLLLRWGTSKQFGGLLRQAAQAALRITAAATQGPRQREQPCACWQMFVGASLLLPKNRTIFG